MPSRRFRRSIKRKRVYEALRRRGIPKTRAARIANAGRTASARSRMARKAQHTRRRRR